MQFDNYRDPNAESIWLKKSNDYNVQVPEDTRIIPGPSSEYRLDLVLLKQSSLSIMLPIHYNFL